jgi:hypothetical protein
MLKHPTSHVFASDSGLFLTIFAIPIHLLLFIYLPKLLFIAETIMSTSFYLSFYFIFFTKGSPSFFAVPLSVITRIFDRITASCGFLPLPPSLQIHPISLVGAALEKRYMEVKGAVVSR